MTPKERRLKKPADNSVRARLLEIAEAHFGEWFTIDQLAMEYRTRFGPANAETLRREFLRMMEMGDPARFDLKVRMAPVKVIESRRVNIVIEIMATGLVDFGFPDEEELEERRERKNAGAREKRANETREEKIRRLAKEVEYRLAAKAKREAAK